MYFWQVILARALFLINLTSKELTVDQYPIFSCFFCILFIIHDLQFIFNIEV